MAEDLFQTALQLHQANNLDQAEELYQKILIKDPKRPDVLHLLGILYAQQSKFMEAQNYIERAIAEDSEQPAFHNSLGNVFKNLNKNNEAIIHYKKALALKPNYASALNNLANIFYQQGDLVNAEKYYQDALRFNPNYADAHYNLGNIFTKQDNIDAAIAEYQAAIHLDPEHAKAHGQLGQLLQLKDQLDAAIIHFKKRLQLEPEDVQTQHNLATTLIKQGKFEPAIEHFKKVLALEPKHAEALHNLGVVYLLTEQLNPALKYFLRLLEVDTSAETYYNIAVIYMHQDRHQDAIQFFLEALKHNPNYLDAHINLGAIYLKIEDYVSAKKHYQMASQLNPDNKELSYIIDALAQNKIPEAAPTEYLQHLFDQYAPYFEKHLTGYLEYRVPQLLYDAVIKELGGVKTLGSILDLGCGTGLAGVKFHALTTHLIGVDISSKMIDEAEKKQIYAELKVADIHQAVKDYSNLDLVVAADVFTYIGNLADIFAAVHAALAPGGLFAFTTEKTYDYPYLLQQSARYAHSQKYLEELAEKNHFKIKTQETVILRRQKNQWVEGYLYILQRE